MYSQPKDRDMFEKVLSDSKIQPTSRLELLLCLCALNLLNTWVKLELYKKQLHPWEIKMQVSMLVKFLLEDGANMAEKVEYNMGNKCTYIRCLGLQFSFHCVHLNNLTSEQRDAIIVNDNIWDRIRLQDVAEELYCKTSDCMTKKQSEEIIKEKLSKIVQHG